MRADEHGLAVAYLQTVEIPDIDLSEAFEAAVLVDFQSTAYEAALIDDLFLKQFLLGSDHVVTRIQYVALRFEIALERSLLLREVAYLRMKPCHLLAELSHLHVHILEILAEHDDFLIFRLDLRLQLSDQLLEARDPHIGLLELVGRLLEPVDRAAVLLQQPVDRRDILVDLDGRLLRNLAAVEAGVDNVLPQLDRAQVLRYGVHRREHIVDHGIFLRDDPLERVVPLRGRAVLGRASARGQQPHK